MPGSSGSGRATWRRTTRRRCDERRPRDHRDAPPAEVGQRRRTDPFFEFGSFGLTGCHASNLLHDEAADGARLAFAQGGPLGFRLVTLTPPVRVQRWAERREARWTPGAMPLAYAASPLLIDRGGNSDVAGVLRLISTVQRETPVAQFASAFRSRKRGLEPAVARQLLAVWNRATRRSQRAKAYWEALPCEPAAIDRDRRATYDQLLRTARGDVASRSMGRRRGC